MGDVTLIVDPAPFEAAARVLTERLAKGTRLAIPGGSAMATVQAVRRQLAPNVWKSLRLTWVDERLVPQASIASNRGEAYRLGVLAHEQRPGLEVPLVADGETAAQAVARAEAALTRDFDGAIDVALLGLGEDGHVASLFPAHQPWSQLGLVTAVNDAPKPPAERLTLTLRVLARAGVFRLIVAGGAGKRGALQRLLDGDTTIPAAHLGDVTVVTDVPLRNTQVKA